MDLLVRRRQIPDPTHDRQNQAAHFRSASLDRNERPALLPVPGHFDQPEAGALSRQNRYRFGRSSARTQSLVPNLAASTVENEGASLSLQPTSSRHPDRKSDGRTKGQHSQTSRASIVRDRKKRCRVRREYPSRRNHTELLREHHRRGDCIAGVVSPTQRRAHHHGQALVRHAGATFVLALSSRAAQMARDVPHALAITLLNLCALNFDCEVLRFSHDDTSVRPSVVINRTYNQGARSRGQNVPPPARAARRRNIGSNVAAPICCNEAMVRPVYPSRRRPRKNPRPGAQTG